MDMEYRKIERESEVLEQKYSKDSQRLSDIGKLSKHDSALRLFFKQDGFWEAWTSVEADRRRGYDQWARDEAIEKEKAAVFSRMENHTIRKYANIAQAANETDSIDAGIVGHDPPG